jgi:hypothetical protein
LLNQAGHETDLTPTVKPNATQSWLLQQPHPKTLPEPLTADIRALFERHLPKGGLNRRE